MTSASIRAGSLNGCSIATTSGTSRIFVSLPSQLARWWCRSSDHGFVNVYIVLTYIILSARVFVRLIFFHVLQISGTYLYIFCTPIILCLLCCVLFLLPFIACLILSLGLPRPHWNGISPTSIACPGWCSQLYLFHSVFNVLNGFSASCLLPVYYFLLPCILQEWYELLSVVILWHIFIWTTRL